MLFEKDSLTREERRIRRMTSDWLVERDSGWDSAKKSAFEAWKAEDVRHEIAVRELETSWNRLKKLRHLMEDPCLRPNPEILADTNWKHRLRKRFLVSRVVGFAALLVVSVGLWVVYQNVVGKEAPFSETYSTRLNDYKQVALQDGSILEINAGSGVRVEMTEKERRIYLLSGEAHFEVAKDWNRPFVVNVGSLSVRAVGTAFNVRYGADEVQVVVTEGRVAINPFREDTSTKDELDTSNFVPDLVAGNQATVSMQGEHMIPLVSKIKVEELTKVLAWKGPRLFFDETPLDEAIQQFNEHNELHSN